MHIIAIAWIYVVSMMALTEKSVVAGIMTFTMYCALPLGLVWFIFTRKKAGATKSGQQPPALKQQQGNDASDDAGTR